VKFTSICGVGAISNVGIASFVYGQPNLWHIVGLCDVFIGKFWNFMVSASFVGGYVKNCSALIRVIADDENRAHDLK
jgi:hypothetical protein